MQKLNILLVEDSPDYSSLVLRWFSSHDGETEFQLIWTDSLAAALARVDQGGIGLILMDLGLPDSNGMATFLALRGREGKCPIIVLSGDDDQTLALQIIQQGAQDYLVKSSCTQELLIRSVKHAVARQELTTKRSRSQESAKNVKTIAVLGSAGGVGVTTIACVLAAELRHHTNRPTLLIELDSNPGLVAFTLGIDPQYTLQDAAGHADRLDLAVWEKMITRRPGNLDILTSDTTITDWDLDVEKLRKIVTFAKGCYRWIVMDLGRLSQSSKRMAGSADELILVSTQTIPALHQCKTSIEMLHDLGIDEDRIRIILNQTSDEDPLSQKDIEKVFGVQIQAILPHSPQDLFEACLKKQLPSVTGRYRTTLTSVALKMAGLPEELPKRSLLSLNSLKDRFQRKTVKIEDSIAS